jgi:alkylhydroperoxidase family enzyme
VHGFLSPQARRLACLAAASWSFDRASSLLEELCGLRLSDTTIRGVATGAAKTLLDAVQKKIGFVPNLMRTLAVSPATLDAYLSFGDRLGKGVLSPKLREQLAATVAYSNSCQY